MSHQVSFLLLYFGTEGLHESTPEGPSFCLELSVQVFHTISASLFIVLVQLLLDVSLLCCPWGVPIQSLFLCGRVILPQCMSHPLPFAQFDLLCLLFLLYTPSQF
jgi:hypothetical protein